MRLLVSTGSYGKPVFQVLEDRVRYGAIPAAGQQGTPAAACHIAIFHNPVAACY
jgi:hypothetical protein